jgi:hypothetical protein
MRHLVFDRAGAEEFIAQLLCSRGRRLPRLRRAGHAGRLLPLLRNVGAGRRLRRCRLPRRRPAAASACRGGGYAVRAATDPRGLARGPLRRPAQGRPLPADRQQPLPLRRAASIYLADRLGSLDSFREYAAGGVLAPSAALFCEVAGSHERVGGALDGVRVAPFEDSRAAVVEAGGALAYKSTDVHWVNRRRSIYAA